MRQRREEALRLSAFAAAAAATASTVALGGYILHVFLYLLTIGYQDGVLTLYSAATAICTVIASTLLLFGGLEARSRRYRRALILTSTAAAVLGALYVYFHLYMQLTARLEPWPILLPAPAVAASLLDALLAVLSPQPGRSERPSHVV